MSFHKLCLYLNTVRYLKPSQIYYRIKKILKMNCSLGIYPKAITYGCQTISFDTVEELDFDPAFLSRFPIEDILSNKITLLHESSDIQWDKTWNFPNKTPLWNYNLHYFEYLFPLVKAYKDTSDYLYLEKTKAIICSWIHCNPCGSKPGWDPYPIALRLTNWLSIYMHLKSAIKKDEKFHKDFIYSIWDQYNYLAHHVEKDLLGNHYFEDLKALILCSIFFKDENMLKKSTDEFHKQCAEQILPDGMHFELSPMYHKLIFEDVMRIAIALKSINKVDNEIKKYLQPMLDVAYSLEEGLDRIPLFNDCGNNVAKSLDALCKAAKTHFGIIPKYKNKFPNSGYYIFKQGDLKLIVDAGQPGPTYLPGHAHCDAMSFELFKNGKPMIVNCGTYAYQCKERSFFRSTAAHNTVQVEGIEQSECWGVFRMGKRCKTFVNKLDKDSVEMKVIDQERNILVRKIILNNGIIVSDFADTKTINSYLHIFNDSYKCDIDADVTKVMKECTYADEFGKEKSVIQVMFIAENSIEIRLHIW